MRVTPRLALLMTLPSGPGFGVTLSAEKLEKYADPDIAL